MPFRDLSGHRRLFGLLGRALRAGSLPPSLIFGGPEGVGKRQAALALAQVLNCLQPVDDSAGGRDACGACASCRKIARALHPDVLTVGVEDGAQIKVDQIRDVVARTAYRPFEGRWRVVVFDDADLMNGEAQDALLKTLEEPPAQNVLVLVTARPDALAPTVRSRCCQLRFGPLAADDIASALVRVHGFTEADARAAAALAGGSIARALAGGSSLSDARDVAAAVLIEASRKADAPTRKALALALLEGAAKKSRAKQREAKAGAPDRGVLAVRLRAMLSLLRDLSVLSTRAPETVLVNSDLREELAPLAEAWDRDRLVRAFSAVGRALAAVERHNASSKIVVDWLAFQL